MPVIFQKMIFREDLRRNPHVMYLFGDNALRRGLGGQAKEMRGEPNAVGICTKWVPGMRPEDFFSDRDFYKCRDQIWNDLIPVFDHAKLGGMIVIPADGLGTGLSQLPERAPLVFEALEKNIEALSAVTLSLKEVNKVAFKKFMER